jgi:hypothetical protein
MRHELADAEQSAAWYDLPYAVPVSNVARRGGGTFVPAAALTQPCKRRGSISPDQAIHQSGESGLRG